MMFCETKGFRYLARKERNYTIDRETIFEMGIKSFFFCFLFIFFFTLSWHFSDFINSVNSSKKLKIQQPK